MNVMDLVQNLPFDQSLLVTLDASHYVDHPEQLKIGLEYTVLNMISLRGGFASHSYLGDSLLDWEYRNMVFLWITHILLLVSSMTFKDLPQDFLYKIKNE